MSRAVCVSCVSIAHRETTKARNAVFKGDSSHEAYFSRRISFKVFNGLYVKIIWSILVKDCVFLGKGKVVFVYLFLCTILLLYLILLQTAPFWFAPGQRYFDQTPY